MKFFYIVCALIFAKFQIFACSEVTVANGSTFSASARSFDFPYSIPTLVEIAPRGLRTTSLTNGITTNPPLSWVSKYGGVYLTPNNEGNITVADGMNEKGLISCILWDETAAYPPLPPTAGVPILSMNLLARYFLDNCATVNEALATLSDYYIIAPVLPYYGPMVLPLHFTLHDATGDSALIEFSGGAAPVVYHPLTQSGYYNVTTNEPQYPAQIANLQNYTYFNPSVNKGLPGDIDPISRFVRLAAFLSTTPISTLSPDQAVAVAFGLLLTTVEPFGALQMYLPPPLVVAWPTQWIRAYDNINLVNYYESVKDEIFYVDLSKIDFSSPLTKHRSVNLFQGDLIGDITALLLLSNNF